MAQRFNAPPGWQVPDGFVPPTGWQPDPAWPPAPDGWNYWVEDGAAQPAPGYGAPAGQPAPVGFGAPGGYGADPTQAPGSANAALAQKQVKDNKRLMFLGFGLAALTLLIFVVSFAIAASSPTGGTYYFPWYLGLIGLALGIRGAVATSKAKKFAAQVLGGAGGLAGAYGAGPAASAPMPPAGYDAAPMPPAGYDAAPMPPAGLQPGQEPDSGAQPQQRPSVPPTGATDEDGGQRPMGGLYR